jgi:transglutaminase-like putative cysteine protease
LTYLPAEASTDLLLYLFTALLLVARVHSVRRSLEWQQRKVQYDGHLWLLSLSDSMLLAVAVLILVYFLPVHGSIGPANKAYELMRTPLVSFEDDFNRLFAGLPARKPLPYRIWDDVMAFQGTIHPTTTPVLQVDSKSPMYWKARSYGTYTAQGWVSENTVIKPIDWVPTYSVVQPYRSRFEISYSVTPNYATKSLFAGGQILGADRDVRIETYDSPTYTLNLADPAAIRTLPPKLALAAAGLNRVVQTGGSPPSKAALEASLPPDFRLVDVVHQQGRVQQVILAEALPQQPDVLSVRSTRGSVRPKETYLLTSSVSAATAGELRGAGMDYPTWALVKYTQLPASVPQRVRDLATRLTAQSSTPYDKAKAIEAYLKTLTYSLEIEPPPYRADGVDHFLFTSRRGYSEYFASSMTVLLRASGVPARLAVGYTVGDKVPDHDIYIVADSHSHAWVEVFFPRYGWVPFEPTPGKSLPAAVPPVSGSASSSTGEEGNLDEFGDEDEDLEFPFLGVAAPPPLSLIDRLRQALPWALVALVVVTMAVGAGWLLWQRYMVPSTNPEVAFRHLALLGALGSVGLMPHQTPFQYREQLSQALPSHGNQLSVIVDAYVRHLYGRKEMADQDRDRLAQAWLEVRGPLLLRVLRRRNP